MKVLKYCYIALIVIYIGIITLWSVRYPLSYRIVGIKPDIIEERSLTFQEYLAEGRTVEIRQWSSNILLYASVAILITSIILLRKKWFNPLVVVKIVVIVAGIIALILILVNGIHFIPGPPIR